MGIKLWRAIKEQGWDVLLFAMALGLSLVSLVAMRSASASLNPALLTKQAVWVGIGLCVSVLVSMVPYTRWIDVSLVVYVGALLLLALVEMAGTVKLGAARWITLFGLSIQPSEMAKFATACCVAQSLAGQPTPLPLRALIRSAALAGIPTLLIFLQPDLGTSSILMAIWFGTVWSAGISTKHLTAIGLVIVGLVPVAWGLLKEYQRARLLVFINPHADPLGAGYTIIQSKIAIGSGQLLGRGWMAGTQNQLNFLPERHSDFLYSVIGEEWGLFGSVVTILLFAGLLWRACHVAASTPEPQGQLLAMALVSWMLYQAVVNMGMVMGLLPVVGVPLPFLSYGGSAMVMNWVAIGLLQGIHRGARI